MIATKIAIALGIAVFGVACWMAVIGVRAASEGLLTLLALVVLVGGGNYLAGRSTGRRRPVPTGFNPPPVGRGATVASEEPSAQPAAGPATQSASGPPAPAVQPAAEAAGGHAAPGDPAPHDAAGEP